MKFLRQLKKIIDKKFIIFLFVGLINTAIGASIMFLLYNVFGCDYYFSSACNYIAGGISSYILNKIITFKNHQKSFNQILQFVLLLVICYLISYIGARHLIHFIFFSKSSILKDNLAMVTGEILYTLLNYVGQRFIVFKNKNDNKF